MVSSGGILEPESSPGHTISVHRLAKVKVMAPSTGLAHHNKIHKSEHSFTHKIDIKSPNPDRSVKTLEEAEEEEGDRCRGAESSNGRSNSPHMPTSAPGASASSPASSSSSRSDKKKPKSETPKKHDKLFGLAAVAVPSPKSTASSASSSPSGDGRGTAVATQQLRDAGRGGASAAALSPILASSLGLNRIKTRSGPLRQEGQQMVVALGSSNLSCGQTQAETSTASGGGAGKEGWWEHGARTGAGRRAAVGMGAWTHGCERERGGGRKERR